MYKIAVLTISVVILALTAHAGSEQYLNKGYIQNERGEKCGYTQKTDSGNRHFYGSLTNTVGIMTFDNPRCMYGPGFDVDTNKMMINNIIARWYSHSDANFMTRASELYKGSALQKKGQCIQSKTYPAIGIAVDYFIKDDSITSVMHGQSLQGCKN